MVQRRHEHLDVVLLDHADAVEQVLLAEADRAGGTGRRRAGELVDELVDAGCTRRAGGRADNELPPCQPHYAGWIRTSEASSCFRYRKTWSYVSGGATCSE